MITLIRKIRNKRKSTWDYLRLSLQVAAKSGHDVDEHVDAAFPRVLLHSFRPVLQVADATIVQRISKITNHF